jgi:RimJ/RimL family protein N-acetyltransferase
MRIPLARALVRDWRRDDAEALARHANSRAIWRNLRDRFPHPYTLAHARDWIGGILDEPKRTVFAIEVDGEATGGIGLHTGSDVHRLSAEIGFWLGEAAQGRGIATDAVRAVTEWGFAELGLRRIHGQVFAWNPASVRVLEKAGYVLEGRLRNAVVKDGEVVDLFVLAAVR